MAYYRSRNESPAEVRRKETVETIRRIQKANDFCLGVHGMVTELRIHGIRLSHNTVDKYMTENDLHSKQRIRRFPKSYYITMKEAMKNLPKNILDRKFHVGVPRNIYVTDITYVPVASGWVYKCIMKDLFNNEKTVETLPIGPLDDLIARQKMRGDANVMFASIEKQRRLSMPFSALILTIIGVSLSARKRRGGIGWNIGIGIALAFSYIFFLRISEMFVYTDTLPPWIALWLPNVLFTVVAYFLYRRACQ